MEHSEHGVNFNFKLHGSKLIVRWDTITQAFVLPSYLHASRDYSISGTLHYGIHHHTRFKTTEPAGGVREQRWVPQGPWSELDSKNTP